MEKAEQLKALKKFRDYVITKSKSNLSRKNFTGVLSNSIKADFKVMENSIRFYFEMPEYGWYQDKGVKGSNPTLVKNGRQKAPSSPFSYKVKKPPLQAMINWAKSKNIRLRDEEGKYKKGNYQTIGFWLQKRIFAQGIKPSLFFTKPFEQAYKKLPDAMIKAYGLEVEELFDTIMKENFKNYDNK
ncbi:MAG: hypothetical protein EBV32_03605 [Proteobacteria bacterium]|uniref:Uncharacterized protein n=1 Tax=Candidatus Fonsibacter lacus TaxID=2576439 RepID=A0A964XS54_9PROT|nr:hypothetical protein [Candidatus Fonsibacter lacus]NCU72196.1 hypothetical protein [Candidatus Fonsibacter lacus]